MKRLWCGALAVILLLCCGSLCEENVQPGDIISFGHYEQDNDPSGGAEPIEWRVLAHENGLATLISVKALDCRPFNAKREPVTWETCSLRKWLNGDFLCAAFTEEERAELAVVNVPAGINPEHATDSGKDTRDRAYLLSVDEAEQFFASDEDRVCGPTAFASARGAKASGTGACWWWLRSPGDESHDAADVNFDGSVYYAGCGVNFSFSAVRPVIVLRLSGSDLQS